MMTWDIAKWALEILILTLAIYGFYGFLQKSQGSAVLRGFLVVLMVLVVGLPLVSRVFDLPHLQYVADQGLPLILIGLVVLFQPELRQVLVRVGDARLMSGFRGQAPLGRDRMATEIVQAAERLSRRGLGAIIVLERDIGIASFTDGAVSMDSIVSAPLLVSIFFKDTPLHDGAVIIRGKRIAAAGAVLPLSDNPQLPHGLGTRHRAAVGATEENDALAVIVSEETQRISIAERGQVTLGVTLEQLKEALAGPAPAPAKGGVI
jgi:diadenylate cyclase